MKKITLIILVFCLAGCQDESQIVKPASEELTIEEVAQWKVYTPEQFERRLEKENNISFDYKLFDYKKIKPCDCNLQGWYSYISYENGQAIIGVDNTDLAFVNAFSGHLTNGVNDGSITGIGSVEPYVNPLLAAGRTYLFLDQIEGNGLPLWLAIIDYNNLPWVQ